MINIFVVEKNSKDEFTTILSDYQKKISQFSQLKLTSIFDNKIAKSQSQKSKEECSVATLRVMQSASAANLAAKEKACTKNN